MSKKKLTSDEYLKRLQDLSDQTRDNYNFNAESASQLTEDINNLNFANPIDAIRNAQKERAGNYNFLGPRQGTFQSVPPSRQLILYALRMKKLLHQITKMQLLFTLIIF